MADLPIDSLPNQMAPTPMGAVPPSGPGSKTPPKPAAGGTATPIGGDSITPIGEPGAPEKDTPKSEDPKSDKEAFDTLVDDIEDALDSPSHNSDKKDAEDKEEKVKLSLSDIMEFLYSRGWTSKRLDYLSSLLDGKEKELVTSIIKHIKKEDVSKTKKLISKLLELDKPDAPPAGAPLPPMGGPPPMDAGGPPPSPPMGAMASSNDREITDVDLNKINLKRGHFMSKKFIIENGAVVESATDAPKDSTAILNKLSLAMRKVKASMKELEDSKLRYAGALVMKYAAEGGFPEEGGLPEEGGMDEGGMDAAPMGEGLGEELPGEGGGAVEKAIDSIEQAEDNLEEAVDSLKEEIGEAGAGEADLLAGGEGEAADDMADKIEAASSLFNEARKVLAESKKEDKKEKKLPPWLMKGKGKGKDDKKKDEKKDGKKDEKKDKEKKGMTLDVEDFAKLVQAKMEELRGDKEANLYPFKETIKAIPKVDNTNAETAAKTISTVDSEIKKQPATDKDNENLNHGELGQKDLPLKTDKGGAKSMDTKQTKVSIEVAERLRKHSVENTVDKARLAVQLSAQQQLKGLIADPLKEALVKGMVESGATAELANAIVHNAYVDAFETSHVAMIDEAFGSLMEKDFDEFVKVAEFVKDYSVKTASAESTTEETFKDKTASADSFGLNGFKDDKSGKADFKGYWSNVAKDLGYNL